MSRRKIVDSGFRSTATPGASHPTSVPAIIAMTIHCVSDGQAHRRSPLAICEPASPAIGHKKYHL